MSFVSALRDRYSTAQDPLRSERRLELVLVVLLAVVLLQLLWFGFGALVSPGVTPVAPARDSMLVSDAHEPGSITATQSLELQSRPLFWQSRRPSATPVQESNVDTPAGQAPARQLQQLAVSGVFGAGSQGGAIVEYKGERMRLRIGDEVDGWALQSVAPGEATFVSAGVRDVRRLLPKPVVAPPSTQAATQPAPKSPPTHTPPAKPSEQVAAAKTMKKQQAKKAQNARRSLSSGGQ